MVCKLNFNEKKQIFILFNLVGNADVTDSLSSSSCSSTVIRPLQTNHSIENMGPFPDSAD
jgi:hypothetical protein